MCLNMHRRAIRQLHACHGGTGELRQSLLQCIRVPLFLLARRLGRSRRKDICQTNDNEVEAWETLFKKSDKQEKIVLFNWPKVYPPFVSVLSAFLLVPLPPQAQWGLSSHLSLLSGLSGSVINQKAALFTSVTLSARLRERIRSVAHRGCDSNDYWFPEKAIIHLSLLHFLTVAHCLSLSCSLYYLASFFRFTPIIPLPPSGSELDRLKHLCSCFHFSLCSALQYSCIY